MTIQTYIDNNVAIYYARNGGPGNPITIRKTVNGRVYTLVISREEPSFSSIPLNVLWISMKTTSPYYKKVARRISKVADPDNSTRNSWEKLTASTQIYEEVQVYDLENSMLLGELLVGTPLPDASVSVHGLTKLSVAQTGTTIAIGTNDLRMFDARTPITHTHVLEPSEQFATAGGAINVDTGAAPVAGQVFIVDSDGNGIWRFLNQNDIFIQPTALTGLTITGPVSAFDNDANINFTARASYDIGSPQTVTPVWTTSDSSIATISPSGHVTFKALTSNTSVTIMAAYTAGGITQPAQQTLAITHVKLLTGLVVTGQSVVAEGAITSYTATASFDYGNSQRIVTPVWTLSNVTPGAVITMSSAGVLTVTSVPASFRLTINARYTLAGVAQEFTMYADIVHTPVLLDHVVVTGADSLFEGSTSAYTLTAYYSNGNSFVKTFGINWYVTMGQYASINQSGVVTGKTVSPSLTPKSDQITAEYTEDAVTKSFTLPISIKPNVPLSLAIVGVPAVLEGSITAYKATLTYANGSTVDVTSSTTFTANVGSFTGSNYTAPSIANDTTITITARTVIDGVNFDAPPQPVVVSAIMLTASIHYGVAPEGINTEAAILALPKLASSASGQILTFNLPNGNFAYFAVPSTIANANTVTFTEMPYLEISAWDGATWPLDDIGDTYGPLSVPGTLNGSPITWYLYRTDFSDLNSITYKFTW